MNYYLDNEFTESFKYFRQNVIDFLRLPPDIEEGELQDSIRRTSTSLLTNYLVRLDRALDHDVHH